MKEMGTMRDGKSDRYKERVMEKEGANERERMEETEKKTSRAKEISIVRGRL